MSPVRQREPRRPRMRRTLLNDGWAYRPKTNRFTERAGTGVEWTPVTLPHDALITTARGPSLYAATGYFGGGVWEYRRPFEVGAQEAGRSIVLEFEGVYRDA